MARTKKQTLVNACERRRQIQEEIRKETLAAKQKKENFLISHSRENHLAARTKSPQNGVTVSGASHAHLQKDNLEKMDNSRGFSDIDVTYTVGICLSASVASQANMSSLMQASDPPSLSEGSLPKAIICIPDICRSPTKSSNEDASLLDSREASSRGRGVWGKASSDIHVKQREDTVRKRLKQSERYLFSENMIESLRSLKAVSEKVREEKRRKSRHEIGTTLLQTPSPGRRSPRRHSPVSSDFPQGVNKKEHKDSRSISDEKPKVNIFTDNLGLDLGKRIRSPRRLSEDMIALPIFSARRWSNSPKENPTGCKAGEEMSVSDGIETLSLHVNLNSESFKSPCVSPISSKKSNTCGTSHKTLSLPGSSKSSLSAEPYMGSKSNECFISSCRNRSKSNDNSPGREVVPVDFVNVKLELHQSKAEHSCEGKPLELNQINNSKAAVSQEHHVSQKSKFISRSNQTVDFDDDDDGESFIFTNTPSHTGVVDNHNISLEFRKTSNNMASIKIKNDKSTPKVQEDIKKRMSSICRELISDSVLVKCENRCMNDSDINEKTDVPGGKNLGNQFNKENSAMKDVINVNINSDNDLQKVNSDTDKEAAVNLVSCVETSASGIPQDMVEEKPQSSLLCAMLVGGKEVARSYSQERVRIKPQTMDTSDSELDMSKGTPPRSVSRLPVPHPLTGLSELNKDKNSVIQIVKSDKLDAEISVENNKLEELVNICDKIDSHEKKDVVTNISRQYSTNANGHVKIQEVSDSAESEPSSVAKKCHINLYNQLKKLNEDVLKLMEIDLEEEFLKELEVDETHDEENIKNLKIETLDNEVTKTSLYNLISTLGRRLCSTDNQIPDYSPVDIDLVESLIQSCPKSAPCVVPKLKTLSRITRIHKRLEEESLKETRHIENKVNTFEDRDVYLGVDNHSSAITTGTIYFDSDQAPSCAMKPVETAVASCNAKDEDVIPINVGTISSTIQTPVSTLDTVPSDISASSSQHDCHFDHSSDVKASPVASSLETDMEEGQQKSSVLKTSIDGDGKLSNSKNTSEMAAKYSFQKSKTCDDFSEQAVSTPARHAGTLRRVNSSPQFTAKTSLLPSPSSLLTCFTKDSHTKSKLGSKIPVPGTNYIAKTRKSWRTPRTIVEPKPLSVLSELENKSSQPNSIFMCINLHKYLNIPSNRVIVTPQKQEEMKILDARAHEEAEKMEMMEDMDTSLDYKRIEPDFDEVDGMLFMSFYSEVELRAHMRVEKALEWDKDDTMLKVSRVKAFEEAKAQNEDMGHFKLKHLRGQHMRWKKYRRLYSDEVKALLEAQSTGKSLDKLPAPKKTLDISKIKGWKRKNAQEAVIINDSDLNFNWSYDAQSSLCEDLKSPGNQDFVVDDDDLYFVSENLAIENGDKPDIPKRSKRRQGFSHQKAHRQLFRELNMDWQDRMIHRKLGGWSLKGNRPQAFSSAAKKRQEKKSRKSDTNNIDLKDISAEAISFDEAEVEVSEPRAHNEYHKKKVIKMNYPLLTEKMVRNALKTLETGYIHRGMRKKKRSRHISFQLPALTPVILKLEPRAEKPKTPMSEAADISLSSAVSLLTSSAAQNCAPMRSSLVSTATMPLEIDLLDEPVMEGVDIASENISSPSVTDTSSLKSCGKPGCRYGCICHLCSVSETSTPLQSQVRKQPSPVCDKEYCRLGCICDSLDPDKPASSKNHCRRPSCMLQCVCPESGNFDGNEDIPYLPSMRRRPKPGERFSNLPQREKTHRSAKNLDAVTRKAMMLYETSEIYCERVERVRKRQPDSSSSPTATSFDSTLHSFAISPVSHTRVTCSNVTFDIDIASEPSEDSTFQDDIFKAEHATTSEATPITFSFPISTCSSAPQYQHPSRIITTTRLSRPTFILDDVRQTVHMMEPSAHKRKRKSHPLSDEIFTSSTCARTQPFKQLNPCKEAHFTPMSEDSGQFIEISTPSSADSRSSLVSSTPVSTKPTGFKLINFASEPRQILPKISSVHTSTPENNTGLHHWDNVESEVPSNHSAIASSASVSCKWSKNMTIHQQTSQNSASSGVSAGNLRQPHGWYNLMVCLKARAPPSSQEPEEEDVKEEDEVKLLEFTSNCNWEGARNQILAKISQCLTRGQYPQPRTINVCEFVVEILPKAHQPSHIPPALRAKLPGQMYSIRLRITRRESVSSRREDDPDVIDLSGLSPVKSARSIDCAGASVVKNKKESVSADHKSVATSSDQSFLTSSSFGISGLSKLFITSPPVSGQNNQNTSSDTQGVNHVSNPSSAPNSRRSSTDTTAVISFTDDHRHSTDNSAVPIQLSPSPEMKTKGSSCIRLGKSSLKANFGSAYSSSESAETVNSTAGSSKLKLTSTSKKSSLKSLKMAMSNQPIAAKTVSSGVTPIFGPFSAKDVKYMIPGKDGTMQLIQVGSATNKNKKLIAVPITLSKPQVDMKCKQNTMVALPVSGMGQSRIVPIINSQTVPSQLKTAPTQQIVLRLPTTSHSAPGVSGVRHPVVLQPLQSSIKGQPPRFQVVPVQIGSCVTVSQATMVTAMAAQVSKSTTLAPKTLNSSDEMIMVFDAAHIRKASHPTNSSALPHTCISKTDKGSQCENTDHSASLTNSIDGPIMTSEISPSKLQTHINGTIDLTAEKVPLENVQTISIDNSRALIEIDDDDSANNTSDPAVHEYGSEKLDATLVGDCGIKLPTKSSDLYSKASVSSSHTNQEDKCFLQTKVSSSKEILSDSSTRNLAEVTRKVMPLEISANKRNNSPSIYLNSPVSVRDVLEPAHAGLKRHITASSALEEPVSPHKKKACLAMQNPIILDEDSVASFNSMSGVQLAGSSPMSNIDRPKSVMSGALSTGSSDDFFVLLSSEEDVDVGEDDKPDKIVSYKSKAERALENDHGNMYTRMDQVVSLIQRNMKKMSPAEEGVRSNGLRLEDREFSKSLDKELQKYGGKNLQKVRHHNQLERLRRSRLSVLFEELQQHVLRERGLPKDHVMSKVKVLVEAKKVVQHLSRSVLVGDELVKKQERKHMLLVSKLAELKANLMQHNVSTESISSVIKQASAKYLMQKTPKLHCDEEMQPDSAVDQLSHVEIDVDNCQQVENVVSCTKEEKLFNRLDATNPPYEDISDPEDFSSLKYEQISDTEENSLRNMTLFNSKDTV